MVSTNTRSFYSSPGPVALRCAAALCLSTRNALFCLIQRPQGTPKGATCISRPLPAHHAAANLAHHHASDRPCQDLPSHLLLNLTVLVDRTTSRLPRSSLHLHSLRAVDTALDLWQTLAVPQSDSYSTRDRLPQHLSPQFACLIVTPRPDVPPWLPILTELLYTSMQPTNATCLSL